MHAVSTRSADDLAKSKGVAGISKSQVSRVCGELDQRVGAFINRPIEGDWPNLWIGFTLVGSSATLTALKPAKDFSDRCSEIQGSYTDFSHS